MLAAIPLKAFDAAKERLDPALAPGVRRALAMEVAARVARACTGAGLRTAIVTVDDAVAAWAAGLALEVIVDPGGGLDAAATAVIGAGTGSWAVVHGDLPLLTAGSMRTVARRVAEGHLVLAPSRDGGTKLLAGSGPFEFAYGPGSFARHIGRAAGRNPLVMIGVATAVEIDTPADLVAVRSHRDGAWLERFLS